MLKAIVSQNPNARILSIRAMDDNGFGTVSSLVAAMEYAINAKVDIINLSLYARTTLSTSVLKQEIQKAIDAGITVIGAAGNDGSDVVDYVPGSVDEAWIIGAANPDGSRYDLSNFGATVDYNVVGESTSVATALFTGYVSLHGVEGVEPILNQGFIYEPDVTPVEKEEIGDSEVLDNVVITEERDYLEDTGKTFAVKYKTIDSTKVHDRMTIDSVMAGDRSEVYLDIEAELPVYKSNVDGKYLVFTDVMYRNGFATGPVMDAVFTRANYNGEVLTDGVVYDVEKNVAVLEESVFEDAGKKDYADVQLQLMLPVDVEGGVDNINMSVKNEDKLVNVSVKDNLTNERPLFNPEIQLTTKGTANNIKQSNIGVYVNGSKTPLPYDLYAYEPSTGRFSIYMTSAVIADIEIEIKTTDVVMPANDAHTNHKVDDLQRLCYVKADGEAIKKASPWTGHVTFGQSGFPGYPRSTELTLWNKGLSYFSYPKGANGAEFDGAMNRLQLGIPKNAFGVDFTFRDDKGTPYKSFTREGNTGYDSPGDNFNYSSLNQPVRGGCHHASSALAGEINGYPEVRMRVADSRVGADGIMDLIISVETTHWAYGGSTPQTVGSVFRIGAQGDSKTWLSAKKVWDDSSDKLGIRPTSVKVNLMRKKSTETTYTVHDTVELNAANNWYKKWTDLDRVKSGVTYDWTIQEETVPGYEKPKITWGANESYETGWTGTITNKVIDKDTSVTVTKTWDDYSNKYKTRPEFITVNLMENKNGAGWTLKESVQLNAANSWKYKWDKLPYKKGTDSWEYKVEEVSVQYYDSSTKKTGTLDANNLTYAITNKVQEGWVSLIKVSDNPAMTDGNKCYSLEGAEYTFYLDAACTQAVGKFRVNKDGVGINPDTGKDILLLTPGTFYYKETKTTDDGHFILDEAGNKPGKAAHKVVVSETNVPTNPVKIKATDVAGNDPMTIQMTKRNMDEKTDTVPSLAGTQFTVLYFDNMDKHAPGCEHTIPKGNGKCQHKKRWVLELQYDDVTGLYYAGLTDKYLVAGSDPLYKDPDVGKTVLPYGTYSIQETQTAKDYTFEGELTDKDGNVICSTTERYITTVDKDEDDDISLKGGNEYIFKDETVPLKITLKKFDENNKALAGVTFHIESEKGIAEKQPGWVADKTTGPDGIVEWTDMYPDTYTITEVKTPDGKTLLKDPIVVDLPGRMTQEEAKKYNLVDPNPDDKFDGVVWDPYEKVYYINMPVFEISNNVDFEMVFTGGVADITTFLPLFGGFATLGGAGLYCLGRSRKRRRKDEE